MIKKCCNKDDNLMWIREGGVWPYEIWECKKCSKGWNIELIRDFANKEER